MAATGTVLCQVLVTGLGADVDLRAKLADTRTPTQVLRGHMELAATSVVLDTGNIANSLVLGLMITAVQNGLFVFPGISAAHTNISLCNYLPEGMSNVYTFHSLRGLAGSVVIQGTAASTKVDYIVYGLDT